ncbi:hypothetical protein ACJJTC_012436 [Scirpophaga incertulas]
MNVKLATQTLSNSVATALSTPERPDIIRRRTKARDDRRERICQTTQRQIIRDRRHLLLAGKFQRYVVTLSTGWAVAAVRAPRARQVLLVVGSLGGSSGLIGDDWIVRSAINATTPGFRHKLQEMKEISKNVTDWELNNCSVLSQSLDIDVLLPQTVEQIIGRKSSPLELASASDQPSGSRQDSVKKLKLHRSQYKSTITRIENFINDPMSFTSASVDMLEARKQKLISSFKDYEAVQLDILNID